MYVSHVPVGSFIFFLKVTACGLYGNTNVPQKF